MKRQLDAIQDGLESCLNNIRAAPVVTEAGSPLSPASASGESNNFNDVESSIRLGSPTESITSISAMLDEEGETSDLPLRFERALKTGRERGPKGENIKRRIEQFNAARSASIAAGIVRASPSSSSSRAPASSTVTLASTKGKAPRTERIRDLIHGLGISEARAPGLWSKESAAAAQALGKAYQDAGDFESALEYYHLALTARQALRMLGPMHHLTLSTMDLIGSVLELQRRWQDALEYYQLSNELRADTPGIGMGHPAYLPIATRVGRMHSEMGEPEVALRQYESILVQYAALPEKGGNAAMAVRADVAKLRLQHFDTTDARRAAEESITEHRRLVDSRKSKLGPEHRLTKEAESALGSVQKALESVQRAQDAAFSAPPSSPTSGGRGQQGESSSSSVRPSGPATPARPVPSPGPLSTVWAADIKVYEEELEKMRLALGNEHPSTLKLMCDLADAYASHEQYEAATSWYHEALRGQETTFGRSHPTTLATVHNLGVCAASKKDYAASLQFLDRAVTSRTLRLARNHPDTLTSMVQLAVVYQALEDYPKAIETIEKAVEGRAEKYGATNPKTLDAKFRHAQILVKKGSLQAAQRLLEDVLHAREAAYTENHPDVLDCKAELGLVYQKKGEVPRALVLLQEAYDGQKVTFGQLHPLPTRSALDLAHIYWETEQWPKALEFYLVALKGIQAGHDAGPTAGVVTMHNIAGCYTKLEQHSDAVTWLMKVVKLYESEFGRDHEKTIEAIELVAHACFAGNKFDEAIEHYHRVLVVKERSLPDSDTSVSLVIFQLFRCTSKSSQTEKALAWGRRFRKIGDTVELQRMIVVMKGMGNMLAETGEHMGALELYQEALTAARGLESGHWLPSNIAYDIQQLYDKMERTNSITCELERQRMIISELLRSDPRAGASMLCQLGYAHARQHMHHEALSLLEEALEAIQCLSTDPEVINLKHDAISGIADAHLELYNNHAAMTYLQVLVDSEEDGRWKLGAMVRMAGALEQDGEFERAIEMWKQVRREEERNSGMNDLDVLCTARKIGSLSLRVGNTDEALRWTQSALSGMRRCSDSKARMQEMTTLSLLSSIHWQLGNLEQALNAQRDCAQGLEASIGADDEKSLEAFTNLADICDVLGHKRDALWWYEKAVAGYKRKLGHRSVKVLNAEQRMRDIERQVQ